MLSDAFNGFSATGSSIKKKERTCIDRSISGIKITCKKWQNHLKSGGGEMKSEIGTIPVLML